MQLALLAIAVLSFIAATIWMVVVPGFEPLLAILLISLYNRMNPFQMGR